MKIVSIILVIAILFLGVAIYRLHTKDEPVPVPVEVVRPLPEPTVPTVAPPVIPEPEITVPFELKIQQGFILKK